MVYHEHWPNAVGLIVEDRVLSSTDTTARAPRNMITMVTKALKAIMIITDMASMVTKAPRNIITTDPVITVARALRAKDTAKEREPKNIKATGKGREVRKPRSITIMVGTRTKEESTVGANADITARAPRNIITTDPVITARVIRAKVTAKGREAKNIKATAKGREARKPRSITITVGTRTDITKNTTKNRNLATAEAISQDHLDLATVSLHFNVSYLILLIVDII